MTEQPTSAVMDLQRAHRSVRDDTDEPVDDALLARLIAAAQGAASSSFIQAYSFVRAHRAEARARIATDKFVSAAPYRPGSSGGELLDAGTLYVARFNDAEVVRVVDLDRRRGGEAVGADDAAAVFGVLAAQQACVASPRPSEWPNVCFSGGEVFPWTHP